jgi:hypothetical protein
MDLTKTLSLFLKVMLHPLFLIKQLLERFVCVLLFVLHLSGRVTKRLQLFVCILELGARLLQFMSLLAKLGLKEILGQRFDLLSELFKVQQTLLSSRIELALKLDRTFGFLWEQLHCVKLLLCPLAYLDEVP